MPEIFEVVITPEHREAARLAVCPNLYTTGTEYWIGTGDPMALVWAHDFREQLKAVALAIATAEAPLRARIAELEAAQKKENRGD